MAESVVLDIQPREGNGTRKARRLRAQGLLPAVVYGHKEATVSVSLPQEAFEKALLGGARIFDLQSNGNTERAIVQEVQWDHLGKDIVHVDLRRVSRDERVVVNVRVQIRGTAPGTKEGGVLDQPIHSVELECLVTDVPEVVRVNVGELQLGQAIHVRELQLPPDIKILDDPEAVVVQVLAVEAEEEEVVEGGGTAEPEIIGRQKAEEEGEEKK